MTIQLNQHYWGLLDVKHGHALLWGGRGTKKTRCLPKWAANPTGKDRGSVCIHVRQTWWILSRGGTVLSVAACAWNSHHMSLLLRPAALPAPCSCPPVSLSGTPVPGPRQSKAPAPGHSEGPLVLLGASSTCWQSIALLPWEEHGAHRFLPWMEFGALMLMMLQEKPGVLWPQSNLCSLASLPFPQGAFEPSKLSSLVKVNLS